MKTMLSMPSTISITVRVAKAAHTAGSESSSSIEISGSGNEWRQSMFAARELEVPHHPI
jgi:hypothetical protein